MEKYVGKPASDGIAIGKIRIYKKKEEFINRDSFKGVEQEIQRYESAKITAKSQLKNLYEKAVREVGEKSAIIFNVQAMLVDDQDYSESVCSLIMAERVNAELAVMMTGNQLSSMFSSMADDYMRERASDIKDISERLIAALTGRKSKDFTLNEGSIVFADDLTPSETIQMDKTKVLALITSQGSVNSHTAILARMMGIPAIVGLLVPIKDLDDNKPAIVNGNTGELIIEPDEKMLSDAQKARLAEELTKKSLLAYRGRESITIDGKKVGVFANIGNVSDLASVLENDADGIGLFRSEFLYLGKDTYPAEEEQFQAYRQVAQAMAGKKVIIRTLDIGADKQVSYFELNKEENPAMGYRAIRICLDRPEIFKTQLRAIFRASAYGNIAIMYPMIISVSEVQRIKRIVDDVKQELTETGIKYGEVEQGIMVETPAAVMESDSLAKEVDFFSIGTNDLTQYTLAIDRQNSKLDAFYDSHHPAILKMIQMVIENGHKGNCWVGICGELGADITLTEKFLEMGIDELSVSPKFVLPIRKIICNADVSKADNNSRKA